MARERIRTGSMPSQKEAEKPSRRAFIEKVIKAGAEIAVFGLAADMWIKELLRKKPVRIAFFGDSITSQLKFQGWVEQGLEEKFPKIDIIQHSIGLPGARLSHDKPEFDAQRHLPEVLALKPEIVVIGFGNNDLKSPGWPDRFEMAMRETVSEMVKRKIKVVLVSPVKGYARSDRNYNPALGEEGLKILDKIAAEFNPNRVLVADVYTPMSPKAHILDKEKNYLHPNQVGHELIGKIISETIVESGWLK